MGGGRRSDHDDYCGGALESTCLVVCRGKDGEAALVSRLWMTDEAAHDGDDEACHPASPKTARAVPPLP